MRLRTLQAGHSILRQRASAGGLFYLPRRLLQAELQYFATKKIGIGRGTVAATPAQASYSTCRNDGTAVIPDFRPRIGNRCSKKVKTRAIRASILDFKPRLANRCSKEVKTGAIRASILDFKLRLANRCSKEVKTRAIRASIPDFSPRLGNRWSAEVKTGAIPPAQGRTALCRGRGMPDGQTRPQRQSHPPQADSDAGTLSTRHKKKSPDSSLNRDSRSAAATYSPTWCSSTIGASELNFSVRDGKRWILTAITAAI